MMKETGGLYRKGVRDRVTNWTDVVVSASVAKVPTTSPADLAQVGATGLFLPEFEDAQANALRVWLQSNTPPEYVIPDSEKAIMELQARDDSGEDMRIVEDIIDYAVNGTPIPQAARDRAAARKAIRARMN